MSDAESDFMLHKPGPRCFGYGQRSWSFHHIRLSFCEISACVQENTNESQVLRHLGNHSNKSVPINMLRKCWNTNELISRYGRTIEF